MNEFKNYMNMVGPWILSAAMSYVNGKDQLKDIDLESEYQLIKQKKSNLSANLRKMVVRRYENK